MTTIRLHPPLPTSPRLERLRLFPGRHLGEDELDRLQAYVDERLAPLLAVSRPGIIQGLRVDLPGGGSSPDRLTVRSGLAVSGQGRMVGLYYPTQATWRGLIQDWLGASGAASAAGVYYLVLRRSEARVDADQGIDPCRRGELDPRRDTRLVSLGTLGLAPLALSAATVAALTPAQLQNRVVAAQVDGAFLATLGNAVPLGLLAVSVQDPPVDGFGYRVVWFSEAAGRYLAIPDSGYHCLLNHTQTVLQEVAAAAHRQSQEDGELGVPPADYLEAELSLDYLPAAGVLPGFVLEQPHAADPNQRRLRWLPAHLGVDMVPVPEESVADLIERHVARRPIDLRRPAGEQIRLLLAVNEPDYRPDLLDIPAVDGVLVSDLHRYFMRAHDAWRDWRIELDRLYAVLEADLLTPAQIRALGLPVAAASPLLPSAFFRALIEQGRRDLAPAGGAAPYPYSEGAPVAPDFYRAWLVPPNLGQPPAPPAPADDGLVIRYHIKKVEMEAVDNRIRELRGRLEKTRDYVLLQRQQLDSQTVSLAALAGGVAGDGTGLQVARWLPFTELKGASGAQTPVTEAVAGGADASGTTETLVLRSLSAEIGPGGISPGGISALADSRLATVQLAQGIRTQAVQSFVVPQLSAIKGIPTGSLLARARSSQVELGLQRDRLDRLKDLPKQAITRPAIEGTGPKFGVIDHIRPEVPEYRRAYRGMEDLIATLGSLFAREVAEQIQGRLRALGSPISPELVQQAEGWGTDWNQVSDLDSVGRLYHALFRAGQILTRQIAHMEDRYDRIEDDLEMRLRERLDLEGALDKLAAQIEESRQRLDGLDGRRSERLGDYAVAQALVRDDWSRVYRADQERTRVLTQGLRGLYYVRVRPAPLSQALTDPLELRHGAHGDLVPGCDWTTEVDVPQALTTFFESVLEVPMADWKVLKPLQSKLPPPARLEPLWELRRYRFGQHRAVLIQDATAAARGGLAMHLAPMVRQTQTVYQLWSSLPAPEPLGPLSRYHEQSAQVLSLKDLLTGSSGELQREAQTLHNRLEQCIVCLLKQLERVQPSVRLEWAQRAEDDRLDVSRPETWPGLERAESADLNAVRTTAELAAWWFRQLDDQASANALGALRAMLRASLIVAALGDPSEILQGQVMLPPRRFARDEPVRLTLNRSAVPGTRLQILDEAQRVVGMLRVEDQDAQGTLARVERVDDARVTISTRFTVLGNRATADWAVASQAMTGLSAAEGARIREQTWRRAGLGFD